MTKTKTRVNWSKEACEECGNEGLASRGEEHVSQGPYICNDCKVYNDAFNAGYEAHKKDLLTIAKKALSDRTAMQHFASAMLVMRRNMKTIAIVMRVNQVLDAESTGIMVTLDMEGHREMAWAMRIKEKLNG